MFWYDFYFFIILGNKPSKKYPCEVCEKEFNSNDALMKHTQRTHATIEYCKKCEETFSSKKELRKHKNDLHKRKKFGCQFCEKSFSADFELGQILKSIQI